MLNSQMSRRKQSNPKPLKGGEEDNWNGENEESKSQSSSEVLEKGEKLTSRSSSTESADDNLTTAAPASVMCKKDPCQPDGTASEMEIKCEPSEVVDDGEVVGAVFLENGNSEEPLKSESSPLIPLSVVGDVEKNGDSSSSHTTAAKFSPIPVDTSASVLCKQQGFICPPCGIKFSSPSTLDAHQMYYCSHRQQALFKGIDVEMEDSTGNVPGVIEDETSVANETGASGEPPVKVSRVGKQYKCTHCSYSAEKKVSLNRHMRMHSVSPATTNDSDSGANTAFVDRYCKECDIRFSNLKTFRAHKLHYCNSRNAPKRPLPPSPPNFIPDTGATPPLPNLFPTPQRTPFLALPTNPILIVPYALVQGASFLSETATAGLKKQDAVYTLLPDGTLQTVTQAIHIPPHAPINEMPTLSKQHVAATAPETKMLKKESVNRMSPTASPVKKGETSPTAAKPLDLSIHRNPSTSLHTTSEEDENEKHLPLPVEHEDIVCAPCIPLLLSTASCSSSSSSLAHSPSSVHSSGSRCDPNPCATSPKNSKSPVPKIAYKNALNGNSIEMKHLGDQVGKSNMTDILMLAAAARSKRDLLKEYPFHPEMLPQLSTILSQLGKGAAAQPDLLNPSFFPMLSAEMLRASSNPSFMRPGNWQCDDCNIRFCKYENYAAHKKHYCSTRKQSDQCETSPTVSPKTTTSPPNVSSKDRTQNVPAASRPSSSQVACDSCGIQFSNLDNLNTHRTYYCLNRSVIAINGHPTIKAIKAKIPLASEQQISPRMNQPYNAPGPWKCPCCSAVLTSTSAIQKHLESHSAVKAYICTICNYRGNTIRGMRTHIRVHFDKRNSYVMEENYMMCVFDDNANEIENCANEKLSTTVKPEREFSPEIAAEVTVKKQPEEEDEYVQVDDEPLIEPKVEPLEDEAYSKNEREEENGACNVGPQHCETCDITFTYFSTFVAHKKYYCPALAVAEDEASVAVGSDIDASSPVMPPVSQLSS